MTTTYDPHHSRYTDEAAVRNELARVYDICADCRRCTDLCASFPTMFNLLDRAEPADRIESTMMTPAEQDRVVDACVQCKLCSLDCPYVPERHEWDVDFPRLMLRARAMQFEHGHSSGSARRAALVASRADVLGKAATVSSSLANAIVTASPNSLTRRFTSWFTGVTATRRLPSFAQQRFSSWFKKRPKVLLRKKQAVATVFPTCTVEYQAADIGRDLVKVYVRNGVECRLSDANCCGAPLLHAGDVKRFAKVAAKNVRLLAAEVRAGTDIVIPQPSCCYVIKHDYLDHVGGPDAELVSSKAYGASEYLMALHQADDYVLDTGFDGELLGRITYHASCPVRAQDNGYPARDLLKLTGAQVRVVQQCAGIDSAWGYHRGHDEASNAMAPTLGELIVAAGGDIVAGDCHLSNVAIADHTHRQPVHPIQVLARAYGIPADP